MSRTIDQNSNQADNLYKLTQQVEQLTYLVKTKERELDYQRQKISQDQQKIIDMERLSHEQLKKQNALQLEYDRIFNNSQAIEKAYVEKSHDLQTFSTQNKLLSIKCKIQKQENIQLRILLQQITTQLHQVEDKLQQKETLNQAVYNTNLVLNQKQAELFTQIELLMKINEKTYTQEEQNEIKKTVERYEKELKEQKRIHQDILMLEESRVRCDEKNKFQTTIIEFQNQKLKLNDEITILKLTNERLQKQIEQLKYENQQLTQSDYLASLVQKVRDETTSDKRSQQIQELNKQISTMRESLSNKTNIIAALESNIKKLKSSGEDSQKINILLNKISQLEKDLEMQKNLTKKLQDLPGQILPQNAQSKNEIMSVATEDYISRQTLCDNIQSSEKGQTRDSYQHLVLTPSGQRI